MNYVCSLVTYYYFIISFIKKIVVVVLFIKGTRYFQRIICSVFLHKSLFKRLTILMVNSSL